jgi:hypothetical protein
MKLSRPSIGETSLRLVPQRQHVGLVIRGEPLFLRIVFFCDEVGKGPQEMSTTDEIHQRVNFWKTAAPNQRGWSKGHLLIAGDGRSAISRRGPARFHPLMKPISGSSRFGQTVPSACEPQAGCGLKPRWEFSGIEDFFAL